MTASLVLDHLIPDPRDEWIRLLRFVGWSEESRQAAARSVEALFGHGLELVAAVYDHLAQTPETAAILGWEHGPNLAQLEVRRRFLTIWLARSLGLDTSEEFALFLFRAGLMHAGLGPHRVQVAPSYVTSSIGLILASFSHYLGEAGLPSDVCAAAMGAWSRYLSAQLSILQLGHAAATELRDGRFDVRCAAYGRLRNLLGGREVIVGVKSGDRLGDVLRKLFNVYPEVRAEVLDRVWDEGDLTSGQSIAIVPTYRPGRGWRVLLNGRDVRYGGGLDLPVAVGDEIALFPPGR